MTDTKTAHAACSKRRSDKEHINHGTGSDIRLFPAAATAAGSNSDSCSGREDFLNVKLENLKVVIENSGFPAPERRT